MNAQDVRTVLYATGLIALLVVAGHFLFKRVVPPLYRRVRSLGAAHQALVFAFVTVAVLGLFPPWNYTFQTESAPRTVRPAPRAFIFLPPAPLASNASRGVELDLGRLGIEWLIVGALTSAALIVLRAGGDGPHRGGRSPEVPPPSPESENEAQASRPLGPKQTRYLAAIGRLRASGATPEEIARFRKRVAPRSTLPSDDDSIVS